MTAILGPTAAVMALTLSGLPRFRSCFWGFRRRRDGRGGAPRSSGVRAAERAGLRATLIWYEAPHRLCETLADAEAVFGDRPAAVARELTKRFETVERGSIRALAEHFAAQPPRGEITLLLAPGWRTRRSMTRRAARRCARVAVPWKDAAAVVALRDGPATKAGLRTRAGTGEEGGRHALDASPAADLHLLRHDLHRQHLGPSQDLQVQGDPCPLRRQRTMQVIGTGHRGAIERHDHIADLEPALASAGPSAARSDTIAPVGWLKTWKRRTRVLDRHCLHRHPQARAADATFPHQPGRDPHRRVDADGKADALRRRDHRGVDADHEARAGDQRATRVTLLD